jgi:HicA-like toxin of HicAB toxin-antitoxin system
MKVRDVLSLLKSDGWYLVTTEGSHRQFKHPTKVGELRLRACLEQHPETGRYEEMKRHKIRYAIVIEKATHNYAAYVPDLPGCVATG